MKIACIGGGPAGLYFAISMKLRDPAHEIEVFERNAPGVTFGWGVVFSDLTVENITANDPVPRAIIADEFAHWDDIDVHFRGETITSSGHGFIGIGRKRLLEILQDRARELGVVLHFEAECDPADPKWRDYDLVIASDGINSRFRDAARRRVRSRHRRPRQQVRLARHVEGVRRLHLRLRGDRARLDLGARLPLRARLLDLHRRMFGRDLARASASTGWTRPKRSRRARSCSPNISTATSSCPTPRICAARPHGSTSAASNASAGPAAMSSCSATPRTPPISRSAGHQARARRRDQAWPRCHCKAAKARASRPSRGLPRAALDEYQAERNLEVLKLQNSARNSTEWFETLDRYLHFEPLQFAYSLLTRTQRISHENLRLRDREWLEGGRALVLEARDRRPLEQDRAADVRAVQAARDGGREPHHRLADGDVFGGRRHARTTSTSSTTASARWAARASSSPR